MGRAAASPLPVDERLLRWAGRAFYLAALAGLVVFGAYIVLRATGATPGNFPQWHELLEGTPMRTPVDWISNVGIGMHYFMGAVLVLAWPILFSSWIRARHRTVHRWTGRVYVSAGLLAGVGGLSFILTHGAYSRSASIAFGIWGAMMMLCSVMAYVNARARRIDVHRAWAIRLFAMVLGSWLFDIEYRAWKDLTGGAGIGTGDDAGVFDLVLLYLFFVPNLLVAEYFIRNRRIAMPRKLGWPALAAVAAIGAVLVYSIAVVSATPSGKYGKHLLELFTR